RLAPTPGSRVSGTASSSSPTTPRRSTDERPTRAVRRARRRARGAPRPLLPRLRRRHDPDRRVLHAPRPGLAAGEPRPRRDALHGLCRDAARPAPRAGRLHGRPDQPVPSDTAAAVTDRWRPRLAVNDAKTRAQAFVSFCDGAEEAGLVDYARRGRQVAEDCLEAIDQLDAERS